MSKKAAVTAEAALQSAFKNDMHSYKATTTRLKFGSLAAALAILFAAPAQSRPGVIKAETYACTSWGAAHEYTMQSLTPKGGQFSKSCPIRLPKGTKVDIINDDDDGYAVVTHGGKTWWVDGERLR